MPDQIIRAAVPHIFRRPVLYVSPSSPMLEVATFLAIGPQIYADGLVVLEKDKLVGRISGWSLANHILERKEKWLDTKAAEIVDSLDQPIDADEPLSKALEIFSTTRFAFVPIGVGGQVAAFLSARDLLGTVSSKRKVSEIASPIVTVTADMAVQSALLFMVEKGIRNLVVRNGGIRFANDRKVLEYLLSHEARKIVSEDGFDALNRIAIQDIGLTRGKEIDSHMTSAEAAKVMADTNPPCLFVQDRILTPWDLVVRVA
jgi:CBS domain-containing protein